jgi:SAM-dependent methyltransferase
VTSSTSSEQPTTWHYGLVARWWAEFNTSGPEIAYFQRYVERDLPALDVACGTGRLLVPYLRAGLDVDGCDVSPDMLALCRERAEREGLSPVLYQQAMHELDLPRKYRTIYVCGSFGLGGKRGHDEEALRRMFEHLEPGGRLLLDNEVLYSEAGKWQHWTKEGHGRLPQSWVEPAERRIGADGAEYALSGRIVEVDPLEQLVTAEIRGFMWRDGRMVEQDEHVLKMTVYFTHELVLMMERAGFENLELRADYTDEAPTADTTFVVFIAQKPSP